MEINNFDLLRIICFSNYIRFFNDCFVFFLFEYLLEIGYEFYFLQFLFFDYK